MWGVQGEEHLTRLAFDIKGPTFLISGIAVANSSLVFEFNKLISKKVVRELASSIIRDYSFTTV